ncbi:MAG: hypothetical protein M1820_007319 [Bogoriella megaspora]|nr:MAG: hypothetical protein M1820_007319 [Bogoriella megaspora]
MLVSLRNRSKQQDLYFPLAASVQAMACDVSSSESRTLHSVQALVLLCCWQLPFGATRNDHSDTFAALACQYGYRLGLHRPKHPGDFEYNAAWDEQTTILRRKTWAGCFIVCQGISATGIPVPIRFDHSLLEVLTSRPEWMPDAIFHQLHTARKSYEICNTLGGHDATCNGLLPNASATLRVFDADLRAHENSFSESWTKQDLIHFSWPRLLLCVFGLFEQDGQRVSQPQDLHHWLALGYATATTVLRTASSIGDEIPYIASHLRKCLINAVFLLLKIMSSSWHPFVDEATVWNCINQGWNMLKSCSLVDHDNMSRTCAVIEYLSNGPQTAEPTLANTTLSVRSRFGANLVLDAVFRARDRFSQSIRDQRPLDYTQAAVQETFLNSVIHQIPEVLPNLDVGASDVDWNAIFNDLCAT